MGTQPKGLCIVTRCTSTDELVARLHPFCGDSSIFVTTSRVWDVGTASRFAITLADKSVVLHGRCTVTGAWTDGDNEFGRPGLKLELIELGGASREVFDRMQENRKAGARPSTPHPTAIIPKPSEISDAFARAMSEMPAPLDDPPPACTERRVMMRPASTAREAMAVDTTARSAIPPLPPQLARPPRAQPAPQPPARAPIGTPLHGSLPLRTPSARRARGRTSIIGLGPCPGADDPDTLVERAPVTVLGVDTAKLEKKVPPLAIELPPPEPLPRAMTPPPQAVTARVPPGVDRAPGSPFVLPANPLMGLSDAALEGFVDCTLYEELADAVVAEPVPVTPSTITRVISELGTDPAPAEARLPVIESFAARLPWGSIARITGVVAVLLMTAFLILFETGRW